MNELTARHPTLQIVAFPSNRYVYAFSIICPKLTVEFIIYIVLIFNRSPIYSFGQEPKTNPELKDWFFNEWKAKYDVYSPVDVKESDVYKFLIQRANNRAGKLIESLLIEICIILIVCLLFIVIWNYGKYVIEKDGVTVDRYGPQAGAILSSVSVYLLFKKKNHSLRSKLVCQRINSINHSYS